MMKSTCRKCGAAVTSKDKVCPSCGIKKPGSRWWSWPILGFIILAVIGMLIPDKSPESVNQDPYGLGLGFDDFASKMDIHHFDEKDGVINTTDGRKLKHIIATQGLLLLETIGDDGNVRSATAGVGVASDDKNSALKGVLNLMVFAKVCAPDTTFTDWLSSALKESIERDGSKVVLPYRDTKFTLQAFRSLGMVMLTYEKKNCPPNK